MDPPRREDEYGDLLRKWKDTFPPKIKSSRPLGDAALATFLQNALALVRSGSEHMQTVITMLASEKGLLRLRELLARDLDTASEQQLRRIWAEMLLPYFKILTHDTVLQSLVVETHHATLMADLCGPGGDRGSSAFKLAAKMLAEEGKEEDLETCVAVLACMLERNSAAKVNQDLQAAAEMLISSLNIAHPSRATERYLRTIRTLLDLGAHMPETVAPVVLTSSKLPATYTVAQDLPGDQRDAGVRHDNDCEDISDIQILPTLQEIQSDEPEYLPREDPSEWHKTGMDGLIDRHFRLVREDTVGQLRNAAKFQLEVLQGRSHKAPKEYDGARTIVYNDVQIEHVALDPRKGLLFVFSFNQPTSVAAKSTRERENWWKDSKRLDSGSLVCLLSSSGAVTFLTVHTPMTQRPNAKHQPSSRLHEEYTPWHGRQRAYAIFELTSTDPKDASALLKATTTTKDVRRSIVEFPGVVLPSFAPTLAALQRMSEKLDVPFTDALASNKHESVLKPPAYATATGFEYNLQGLLSREERKRPQLLTGDPREDMESALQRSGLDQAQQRAVKHALSHSLALIQGPPGTGKSFSGVKLIEALLSNKNTARLGPIICVCYTNHALDQLLEHLLDAGVQQIVRIGSRSKSERLASVNLRTVALQHTFTKNEGHAYYEARKSSEEISEDIDILVARLNSVILGKDSEVLSYLKSDHPAMHAQLATESDEEGWTTVRGRLSPVQHWLRGGQKSKHSRSRSLLDLQSGQIKLTNMSHAERNALHRSWLDAISSGIYQQLEARLGSWYEEKSRMDLLNGERDLRILSGANVIGITTTGLARSLENLEKLTSKVLVVEEAGEVLEAHLLTAMLPSLEHAILIGDHQQLRPKVQNYELSVENPRSQLALDVSLFERLVAPRENTAHGLPFVTLNTQRRMHPTISELIRSTLYPDLQDSEVVHEYPQVAGMRQRLFWLDHDRKEDGKNQHMHATSHTNSYEVDMVASLVSHLQRQGVYSAQDIAVLTPYLGQLRKLKQKLGSCFGIILNDRDVSELAAQTETPEAQTTEDTAATLLPPTVTKGNLLQAIRLATVDNFQGEEAKVIIISLVRSNEQRKCGFLRTPNRINVLLSRAQHGMYIVGNCDTSSHIPMWQQVVDMMKDEGRVGPALELACPRHPDTPLLVREPDDFARVAPEAGCDLMCGKQLLCGHSCPNKCHAEALHNDVYCLKDCNRPKKGCEHPCKLPCGSACEPYCTEAVQCDMILPCGHSVAELPCWQFQDNSKILCSVEVERAVPGCGHKAVVACSAPLDDLPFQCQETCKVTLDCGHTCEQACSECRTRDESGDITKTDHGRCRRKCDRNYTNCSHSCQKLCHGGEACPPCNAPCQSSCLHSRCSKRCHEPCTPCTEVRCSSQCPHSACQMPCGAPCDWIPCSKRCEKMLTCGHQCPTLCGEVCAAVKYCQVCAVEEIKDTVVDLITMETYSEVNLDATPCLFLSCGHIFTVDTLDGQMDMSKHYKMDKSTDPGTPVAVKGDLLPLSYDKPKACPNCRSSLRSLSRYGRIVRRTLLDESTKKFITWSNQTYVPLAEQLKEFQDELHNTTDGALVLASITLRGTRDLRPAVKDRTGKRYEKGLNLRKKIIDFEQRVRREEQPFQRVHDMVEAVRRRQTAEIPAFEYDESSILQTRGQLLAQALIIRCDLVICTDLVAIWENMPINMRENAKLFLDFSRNRVACETLLAQATKTKHVLQQAEGNIFWAHFAALDCAATPYDNVEHAQNSEVLKQAALLHLAEAEQLCKDFPGQTASVTSEVDRVRQMLDKPVSSSEMRMVVAAMQKTFSSTGHWYRCTNGHPFTVGECGLPMELARCPQCNARIGGQSHQAAAGVTHAHDIEQEFGNLRI